MDRVQRGLLAAGALLFISGMAITLGPATGLIDGPGVDSVVPGDPTPAHPSESGDVGGTTPTDSSDPEPQVTDGDGDASGSQASDGTDRTEEDVSGPSDTDESTIALTVDVGNDDPQVDEEEREEEDEEGEDGDEADEEEDDGGKSDRGNGEKRGHDR